MMKDKECPDHIGGLKNLRAGEEEVYKAMKLFREKTGVMETRNMCGYG